MIVLQKFTKQKIIMQFCNDTSLRQALFVTNSFVTMLRAIPK